MSLRICCSVVILVLLGMGCLPCAEAQSCRLEALPPSVRVMVEEKYPGWKIVTAGDLNRDDQKLWREAHGTSCPGLTTGHFEGTTLDYAISLIRLNGNKMRQALIVITTTEKGAMLRVLDPPSEVARPAVVTKLPPGKYSSADRSQSVVVQSDVVQEETIEAGASIFYWRSGAYHRLDVSE